MSQDFRPMLNEQVARLLAPLCFVLSALYVSYLLVPLGGADEAVLRRLRIVWGTAGFLFLVAGFALLRWRVPPAFAHPALIATAAIVLTNSLRVLYYAGPLFSGVLIIVMVGYATLAMSLGWFLVIAAASVIGWFVVASLAAPNPAWAPASVMVVSSAAIAILTQVLRVRAMRRLVLLQREQLQATHAREQKLLRADLVNAAAHEVATPLTPILIELYQLREHEGLSGAQRARIDVIERNLERLRSAVGNIHKLSMGSAATPAVLGSEQAQRNDPTDPVR